MLVPRPDDLDQLHAQLRDALDIEREVEHGENDDQ